MNRSLLLAQSGREPIVSSGLVLTGERNGLRSLWVSASDPKRTSSSGQVSPVANPTRHGVRAHSVVGVVCLAFNGAPSDCSRASVALSAGVAVPPEERGSLYHEGRSKTEQQK